MRVGVSVKSKRGGSGAAKRRWALRVAALEDRGETVALARELERHHETGPGASGGVAIGGRLEGAVYAHARRALEAGATAEQIRQVVALAPPTMGFPTTVAAFTWVEEVPAGAKGRKGRR